MIPPDPEGIAFDERRQQLYWSSEGERIATDPAHPLLLDPWVRVAGLNGDYRGEFALPSMLDCRWIRPVRGRTTGWRD